MLLNYGVEEDSWESLGRMEIQPVHPKGNQSWIFIGRTAAECFATWCKELIHLKRPWCWERLKAGEGDNRGWDGWMASPTRWTWVWVNSGIWWWTGGLVCCCPELDMTEWLNWSDTCMSILLFSPLLQKSFKKVLKQFLLPKRLYHYSENYLPPALSFNYAVKQV